MSDPGRVEPKPLTDPADPAVVPVAVVEPPKRDWREDRIAELSGRLKAEKEARAAEKAELETRLAAAKPADPTIAPAVVGPTEAEIAERVRAEAVRLNSVGEFNRACDGAVAEGRKQFTDFDAQLRNVQAVVTPGDPASQEAYWGLIRSALRTGDAPRIIHKLGQDKNEAARLMSLDPESRAVELTRMAMDPTDNEISGTPKPITPVGGRGTPHTSIDPTDPERSDRLTTPEWMKRREAQVAPAGARR